MSTLLIVFCQENQINCSSGTEEEWNIMFREEKGEKYRNHLKNMFIVIQVKNEMSGNAFDNDRE